MLLLLTAHACGRVTAAHHILGAVVEMADLTSVPVPTCESVLALVRQLARAAGCYPEPYRDAQKQ